MILPLLTKHQASPLHSGQEAEVEYDSNSDDFFFFLNQKSKNFPRNSLADFPETPQPECVTGSPLAAKEAATVACRVEKDKGKEER